MKIAVFQILDSKKDKERVRFSGYKETIEWVGKIDPAIYDKVFETQNLSDVPEENKIGFLETLYEEMNVGDLRQFVVRSLSVSDVILLDDEAYFVDSFGFKKFPADEFLENTGVRS